MLEKPYIKGLIIQIDPTIYGKSEKLPCNNKLNTYASLVI